MLRLDDVDSLSCPRCRGGLSFQGGLKGVRLWRGSLTCRQCSFRYDVARGVAKIYVEGDVRGKDKLLRVVYDGLPNVHDPLVRFSFPYAVGETEDQSRSRYLSRLELDAARSTYPKPFRILEVGAGTGSNVPLLRQRLRGVPVEIYAVDLSLGMLGLLAKRMRFHADDETRFFAADAHALPFPNAFFDRVFHVGAINSYRDPRTALAEMARVARPATPLVVVDERLDPSQKHDLGRRLFFKWMTIYDTNPHAPVEHLPPGARDVSVEQMGRFFYCMTFSVGATPAA